MKWKMILGVLCLLLIGLPVHAEEQTYIVKFNDSMQYYSSIEKSMSDRYCSATYDELQEYLDMGIVEYFEVVSRTQIINEADHLLSGVYAGTVDLKKVKNGNEKLNWMREIE